MSAGTERQQLRGHRIAHVITESSPFGGAQRNTLLTVGGLRRDGFDTELICGPGGPLIREARAMGVPVHVVDELLREVRPGKDTRAFWRLFRLFRKRRYRLVHTHSTKAGLLGRLAARAAGVPVVVHTVHGYPFEMRPGVRARVYAAVERLVAAMTDRIVCVGELLKEEVAAWRMAPRSKLVTIYSGIDLGALVPRRSPGRVKAELALDGAWPIVGSVGRLSDQKAQHYLIEAIDLLRPRYPRVKCLLVGEGPRRPSLERQVLAANLSSNVSLVGERDDVADMLGVFDVYAMSSRWEGVGRALSEAMHAGLPIVATAVSGVAEVVRHGETGLLVPPHDPAALAMAIDRLASDGDLARRLGANARRLARDLMDGERMIKAIEELYAALIGAKGEGRNGTPWPKLLAS